MEVVCIEKKNHFIFYLLPWQISCSIIVEPPRKKIMESHYMTLLVVSSSSIWIILMRKHVNLEWERMDAQSAFDGVNLYITYLVYIFKSPPFLSSQSRIGINTQLFDPSLDLDYPGQNQLLVKHMMQVKGNNGWHHVTYYIMIMAMKKKNSRLVLCCGIWLSPSTLIEFTDARHMFVKITLWIQFPEFCFWISLTNFREIKSPESYRESFERNRKEVLEWMRGQKIPKSMI